ncbi:MAG TPA: WD40 repeat domain-containing protein [Candidatus Limnocylindrales bacterium]|nr:WD40 repeat domain-containing protein [Candidatus Limnocylindrales bacterium]
MSQRRTPATRRFPAVGVMLATLALAAGLQAQVKPKLVVEDDCQQFAVGPNGVIAYTVPHLKRVKKVLTGRDDIWVVTADGRKKRIVEGEKFMPVLPPTSYVVDSLRWSPDGHRLAVNMTIQTVSSEDDTTGSPGSGKAILLLDENGGEIKVAGSEKRFIEDGFDAAWLGDGATVVYLTGVGPYQIWGVKPSEGKAKALFEGHTFDGVVWDPQRNQAFGVGKNLSLFGREVIVDLNLLKETVSEVARVNGFEGRMSVSQSGNKIGYFKDGDTIEVIDLRQPQKPVSVRVGYGRFEFGADEKHVLLKRGPVDKSGSLVWVGIADGSFQPILHDLLFHDFEIAPGGNEVVVTDPGKRVLKVYPLT